jgi:hypothetical protein
LASRSTSSSAARGGETVPLITRAGVPTIGNHAPTSTREPRLFLGLRLYQWGLLALGAGVLYICYLGSGVWAWRHEGRRYHIAAICVACVSGVRVLHAARCLIWREERIRRALRAPRRGL